MKGNDAGARGCEIRDDSIDRFHHQMHIDGSRNAIFTQGFQYHRTHGQIRYIVVVHDVKMHDVTTGSQSFRGVLTQASKISRQD